MSSTDLEKQDDPRGADEAPTYITPDEIKESGDLSTDEAPEKGPQAPQITFPEGGLKAWSVAIGGGLVLFGTFGYVNAFGVFQEYYQTHQLQDKSPSTIAWIGSLQTFFMFCGFLFGGPLFDMYGAKPMFPACLVLVFSVMMTSLCKEYYQFILAQGLLGGCAMGMTMAPGLSAIGQYFNKNRGAAMGAGVAGSSIGGVIFPIAISRMLANPSLGFGWTIRICGFLIFGVLMVACTLVRARLPPRSGRFFLLGAFTEKAYIALIAAIFLIMLGLFTPFFYLPTFAIQNGMSIQLSSYLISILNGASFFGRVIPGILADRVGRYNILGSVAIISGVLVFCLQKMTTNPNIIAFSVLYGFFSGAIVSMMSVCIAQIPQHPRDIGTYMGQGMAIVAIGALIGPPSNGALVSHDHSFNNALNMSGVFVVVGGALVFVAKVVAKKGMFTKG